jgi:hypothetical protein
MEVVEEFSTAAPDPVEPPKEVEVQLSPDEAHHQEGKREQRRAAVQRAIMKAAIASEQGVPGLVFEPGTDEYGDFVPRVAVWQRLSGEVRQALEDCGCSTEDCG